MSNVSIVTVRERADLPSYEAKLQLPTSLTVVEWLKRPEAYPEKTTQVQFQQTHISWLFLTDRFVYKLKKPVRFDFLEFVTPESRREACEAEVRLNRRMARDVYLGVLPITLLEGGRLALGGRGSAIDWVVKMRRLPADRMLDELIRNGRLTQGEVQRLAVRLAEFYHHASPLTLNALGYGEKVEAHVRGNRRELLVSSHGLPVPLTTRVHTAQLRFLRLEAAQFENRVRDGRLVDGHGDLRPEHICLEAEPVVFDCIEFRDEFRQVDVADELAFLAMECDALGAGSVGKDIVDVYRRRNQDRFSDELFHFYQCYRACVRAKVMALQAAQAASARRAALQRSLDYLHLAARYAERLGPVTVIIVSGLMGTGKSTLAAGLAEILGCEHLSTDAVRRELFGPSTAPAAFGEDHYRKEDRDRVYDELLRRAAALLDGGLSVVLDGTFLAARHRRAAADLARRHGTAALAVRCVCPEEVALERLAERTVAGGSLSEARGELYAAQRAAYEAEEPALGAIEIDTTAALRFQESAVLTRLKQLLASARR